MLTMVRDPHVAMRTEHFATVLRLVCILWGKYGSKTQYVVDLSSGAGSEYRWEGGGFLRTNTPVCLQRDSHIFPPRSLLHLPKPADFTSAPSQDRRHLVRRPIRRQKPAESTRLPLSADAQSLRRWLDRVYF